MYLLERCDYYMKLSTIHIKFVIYFHAEMTTDSLCQAYHNTAVALNCTALETAMRSHECIYLAKDLTAELINLCDNNF
jgi:hypothetical protein